MNQSVSPKQKKIPEFLEGNGEMAERIREFDWSQTSLGPVSEWPKSLRTCVQIMLTSRQPIWIGWGKELIKLYNDPYKTIVMGKHPWALGKPASVVWKDIWKDIELMLQKVMKENEGIYVEEQLLIMERSGYPEETYYTFSYTPVAGDDGTTEGMICFNTDDTDRIISERQLKTLTQLGKRLADVKTREEIYEKTFQTINENPRDFPFALLYEIVTPEARLIRSTDPGAEVGKIPEVIDLSGATDISRAGFSAVMGKSIEVIDDLKKKVGNMPRGPWEISPDKAIILPINQPGQKEAVGFLIVGLNPYRLLDEKYRSFFELVADQISTSMTNLHAIEEERRRLEALAEIDRAKTTFFSNISHEFRTPLTLLLGPVEDMLNDGDLKSHLKEKAEVAFRNALRMQKLVNMLLDFSRIEARKMEANVTAVDIASVTEDLASNFRSAVEKAGMKLIVKRKPIRTAVLVDVDMWEKVILNLLSNAFKYSVEGEIRVSIYEEAGFAKVSVADTGVGIPEQELDKIFERFHRVQNVSGRSQEGTGIGLAMVKELVKLHNGSITVKSKVGKGSEFIVALPLAVDPVSENRSQPKNTLASKASHQMTTYVDEALQWISDSTNGHKSSSVIEKIAGDSKHRPTVLLADDNSDMRRYVERLLSNDYEVILAVDGEEAAAKAIEFKPDIILSDIMMPRLDGFGLLKKLKGSLSTSSIPVIFLSARAGEEAKIEGILAGADDYLTKPFSSRELLARVGNQIAMTAARRKTEHEFYNLFYQSPAHIIVMKGPEHLVEFFHPKSKAFTGGRDLTGMKMREGIPEVEGQGYFEMLDKVYQTGESIYLPETKATLPGKDGKPVDHYFNITYLPWRDLKGNIQGLLQFSFEVTEVVEQRLKAELSERRFRSIAQQAPVAMAVLRGPTHIVDVANDKLLELWGKTYEKVINKPVLEIFPEIINQGFHDLLNQVYQTGNPFVAYEMPVMFNRGDKPRKIYVNLLYEALRNERNEIEGIVAVGTDVSEQVNSRLIIEDAEYKLKDAVELAELGTWHINLDTNFIEYSRRVADWWGLPEEGSSLETVIACIHPEDQKKVSDAVSRAIESSGSYEADYRLVNAKTGEERYIQASGKVFYDEEKVPFRLSGIARDVTLHKSMQHELEKLVESRTHQLTEVNGDLLRSNENLRQFAYVASHDLQEPLRKIQTYSDLVHSRNRDSEMVGKEYIEKIASGARRMSTLIKALLEFSQAERKDELFENVDLNNVLQNIKSDYEVTIGEKRAVIQLGNLCSVEAIPLQMNQLFYNLVGNALKFSKEEETPRVTVTSRSVDQEEIGMLKLNTDGQYCEIRVQDNGIGFEQKYADQIFVLFQRLHVRDKYEGTGIGLALCKKIVENHKGILEVESQVGLGTTFRIILPTTRV